MKRVFGFIIALMVVSSVNVYALDSDKHFFYSHCTKLTADEFKEKIFWNDELTKKVIYKNDKPTCVIIASSKQSPSISLMYAINDNIFPAYSDKINFYILDVHDPIDGKKNNELAILFTNTVPIILLCNGPKNGELTYKGGFKGNRTTDYMHKVFDCFLRGEYPQ